MFYTVYERIFSHKNFYTFILLFNVNLVNVKLIINGYLHTHYLYKENYTMFYVIGSVGALIVLIIIYAAAYKISARFCFMPSSGALIGAIIYFVIAYYFIFPNGSGYSKYFGIYMGALGLLKLIISVRFVRLESLISEGSSISTIIELNSNGKHRVFDVVQALNLKSHFNYDDLIPRIIDNLKYRNKLPADF